MEILTDSPKEVYMLRDALKVSEMRVARKKVAKEPGVVVLQ